MIRLGRSFDLKACIMPMSLSASNPAIDGMPLSRPSRRWQDAQDAASWAPRSSLPPPPIRAEKTGSREPKAPAMDRDHPQADHELVFQPEDGAAVLFPDEFERTAIRRPQVELDERVGRNGLVKIGAEHHHSDSGRRTC